MARKTRPILAIGGALVRAFCDRSGAQAVEFALVAPTLVLLIFGGMEFGRLLWVQSALHYSVEQAARCGALGSCTTSTAAAYAATMVPAVNLSSSVFSASNPTSGGCSGGFKVNASYPFTFIASGLFKLSPTLTAQACFACSNPSCV